MMNRIEAKYENVRVEVGSDPGPGLLDMSVFVNDMLVAKEPLCYRGTRAHGDGVVAVEELPIKVMKLIAKTVYHSHMYDDYHTPHKD